MRASRRVRLVVALAVVGSLGWAAGAGADAVGRAAVAGSAIEPSLIAVPTSAAGVGGIAADAGHIYWANPATHSIERANLDGSGVEPRFITIPLQSVSPWFGEGPYDLAVDAAHIYWTIGEFAPLGSSGGYYIGRANLDGSGVIAKLVTVTPGRVSAIAVGGGHIYWTIFGADGTVGRANLDGSLAQPRFIVPAGGFLTGIAVDDAHIYWSQACTIPSLSSCRSGTIWRANLDGSDVRRDFITAVLPTRLALDAGHIYWAKSDGGFSLKTTADTIGRANLDGSGIQQDFITMGSVNLQGVAVGGTHIYWTSTARPTSALRLTCSPDLLMPGGWSTCTATVTNIGTPSPPTGTVTFTARDGTFSARSCTLSGSGASAACQVRYKPTSSSRCPRASGPCSTITARYSGDSAHPASTESTTIGVVVIPRLTNVSQSAQRWRRGKVLPHYTRVRAPVGTIFTFTLNQPYAEIRFDFTHLVPGRLVSGKCVAPTTRNRGKPRCHRTVTAATLRHSAHKRRNSLHFEGRINRRTWLAPGSYTLKITATAYGRASRPAFLHFTILR